MAAYVRVKENDQENEELISPFLTDEIRKTMFQILAAKSPGPDGW